MAAMSTMPDRFVIAFVLPRTGAATDDTGLKISIEWNGDGYRRAGRPGAAMALAGLQEERGCMAQPGKGNG